MKRLIIVSLLLTCANVLFAQKVDGLDEAINAIKSVRESAVPYGFDMKYSYANESKPTVLLDSLNGAIVIAGKNYYCKMDSTETISNDRYNIVLFREDKIMYVGAARSDNTEDPIGQMQGVLEKSGANSCTTTYCGTKKIINVGFAAGGACKQLKMVIDTAARHMLSMEYLIKTAMLIDAPDAEARVAGQGYDEYAVVNASFYNYHPFNKDTAWFNENQFFYKEGSEYKPAPAYREYQIVLATPNL